MNEKSGPQLLLLKNIGRGPFIDFPSYFDGNDYDLEARSKPHTKNCSLKSREKIVFLKLYIKAEKFALQYNFLVDTLNH